MNTQRKTFLEVEFRLWAADAIPVHDHIKKEERIRNITAILYRLKDFVNFFTQRPTVKVALRATITAIKGLRLDPPRIFGFCRQVCYRPGLDRWGAWCACQTLSAFYGRQLVELRLSLCAVTIVMRFFEPTYPGLEHVKQPFFQTVRKVGNEVCTFAGLLVRGENDHTNHVKAMAWLCDLFCGIR